MSARDILSDIIWTERNGKWPGPRELIDAILADKRIAVVELPTPFDDDMDVEDWEDTQEGEPPRASFDVPGIAAGPVRVWNDDEVQYLCGETFEAEEPLSVHDARVFAAALLAACNAAEVK